MKRVLLIPVLAVVVSAIIGTGIYLLHGAQPSKSGPAHLMNTTEGRMRCVAATVTTCSVTITNASSSRDSLTWTLKEVVPADGQASSSTGTLQPGESSQFQIVFPASSACPYKATFLETRSGADTSQSALTLTQHCA